MNKAYKRINWENSPSTASPVNETNLNKMDYALDLVDTRVVEIYNQKDAMATATTNANKAADSANTAATKANTAAANANEAAQAVLDEKYILTARTEMVRSGTARPTARGNALLEKLTGSSWQRKLTGKNLWNIVSYENLGTSTTFKLNNENSFTVSGLWYVSYLIQNILPNTDYTVSFETETGFVRVDGINTSSVLAEKKSSTFVINSGNNTSLRVYCYGGDGSTSNERTYSHCQIEKGSVSTDYEPFCGGTPSPNPEFSQTIHSVGDSGYAIWEQGVIAIANGSESESVNHLRTQLIPCKEGDVVKLIGDDYWLNSKNDRWCWIHFYSDTGVWIKMGKETAIRNGSLEATIPSGVAYIKCCFTYHNITPSTVGKVSVTINGNYAAIVDEVWKNLLKQSSKNTTVYDVTFTTNDDESVTVNGTPTQDVMYPIGVLSEISGERYILSGSPNGSSVVTYWLYLYDNTNHHEIGSGNSWTSSFDGDATLYIRVKSGINVPNVTFKPMIRRYDDNGNPIGSDDYTPYIHKRTYIPLDEPLRGIGDVKDELVPVDGVYRRLKNIFRTSLKSNASWELYFGTPGYFLMKLDVDENYPLYNVAKVNVMSNRYVGITRNKMRELNVEYDSISVWGGELVVRDTRFTDVSEFKAFLEKTEVIVDYVLDKPILSPFEDQSPFYNLQSFDEVTNVSIVGLNENVEPTLTMRFPRHEDGALVTTAYCNGKKNEIRMDELTAAMLALGQA